MITNRRPISFRSRCPYMVVKPIYGHFHIHFLTLRKIFYVPYMERSKSWFEKVIKPKASLASPFVHSWLQKVQMFWHWYFSRTSFCGFSCAGLSRLRTSTALYRTVLECTVLYCTVPYSNVLYSTVLGNLLSRLRIHAYLYGASPPLFAVSRDMLDSSRWRYSILDSLFLLSLLFKYAIEIDHMDVVNIRLL